MEGLTDRMKHRKTDYHSESSTRMPQRPPAVKSGEGVGFQLMDSSFGPPKPTVTYGKDPKTKLKSGSTHPPKPKRPNRIADDESEDELLLSSSQASSPVKRAPKGKNRGSPSDSEEEEETVRVNGRVLPAHPSYKPSSLDTLKSLRFKKTKKDNSPGDAPRMEPPSFSLQDSQDNILNPISDDLNILSDQRKRELPLRAKSPQLTVKAKGKQTVKKSFAPSSSQKTISRGNTFPNLSPLSAAKEKGKARAAFPEVDEIDLTQSREKRRAPKPFPMSSQMLASTNRLPSPTTRISKATKRASDDSSGEKGHTSKKLKDSRSGVLEVLDYLNEPSMVLDDSIDLGYARDPSKTCPYCDEELPSHPTPFLQNLLATARTKSRADPRPRNPRGLKAPLTIYISVCQRHRFESHQLPIASEKGWPKTIDFTKVPGRVKAMKKQLEAIIMDNDDVSDIEGIDVNDMSRGSRSRSVFWREVKKEVKKQGSRTAMGVKGQFANFEKTQPGYYGERGSVIIHQTLFDLFPPSTFNASLITPLAPAEFIQRILVPEAAVRLIAQDLCTDIEDAIITLRESAQYGVAMFPDTNESKRADADDDEMGVADQIVMERARLRRKELEEEERVEEEMLEEERAALRARARETRREKALERAKGVRHAKKGTEKKPGDESELSEASTTRRTRQAVRQRTTTDNSESDAMSVDRFTSRRSTRSRASRTVQCAKAKPEADASDSDSVQVVSDSRNKAPIKRSRTREPSFDPIAEDIGSRERKKGFGGFASLTNGDDHETTPRPSRQRKTTSQVDLESKGAKSTTSGTGSEARLPLQIARNRSATSTTNCDDGWSRSLRSNVPDDSDSDTSKASRTSQRLVRPPQRSGGFSSWLFSEPSTPTSD